MGELNHYFLWLLLVIVGYCWLLLVVVSCCWLFLLLFLHPPETATLLMGMVVCDEVGFLQEERR